MQVTKRKGDVAYGKDAERLVDGIRETGRWQCTIKSKEAGNKWAELFDSFTTFHNHSSVPQVVYRTSGHQTCAEFTRHAYGIPESAWFAGMANAKKGAGGAAIQRQLKSVRKKEAGAESSKAVSATSEATQWWKDLIAEWDHMPNEHPPVIKYPPYVAEALYDKVYLPEMLLYSNATPLVQKDGKAPGSWFRCRELAVIELSRQEFGLKPGTTTGEPLKTFKLMERPNHSNFAECVECRKFRKEKEQNIIDKAPREKREQTRAKQVPSRLHLHPALSENGAW